ncbi:MAG TPA: CRISPR-associated endonuclease Cas2 [Herpetosiphon sp.]|uniref:CRISPR-associated endoribonuclease Cas2 n=1 Tax=Herpetosiphon aurantiacus (strain ATCC 23779 / DSM 785 / 114-95) TaxID=316274 RepID=A9AYP9_HERA2|nr:CRISPR-associated endonuclease Cas2 [Herpetosiphon sp.]ABX05027.1 CRISPR-associated protein Cas2 [Herpetosiphon aurantiacus DSM 785]HBW50327.1 CRISPR-associated endonuclease Cas2 [Herpetosiphon sp.]
MFILISYDIPHDKRRSKIAKTLENFGKRVQYSVFECQLTDSQLADVRGRLTALVVPNEDSIRFYSLPKDAVTAMLILGHGVVTHDPSFYWTD